MQRLLRLLFLFVITGAFYVSSCFCCDAPEAETEYRLVPFKAAWAMPFPGSSSEYILRKGKKCIAVLAGDQDIGALSYHMDSRMVADIDCLFLHPDYRGKGLGSRLLTEALSHFEALGCKEALLVAFPIAEKKMITIAESAKKIKRFTEKAKRLVSFYKRHGFEIDDRWIVMKGNAGAFMRQGLKGKK